MQSFTVFENPPKYLILSWFSSQEIKPISADFLTKIIMRLFEKYSNTMKRISKMVWNSQREIFDGIPRCPSDWEMCLLLVVCPMLLRGKPNDGLESSKLLEKKWPYNSLRFRLDSTSTVRKAVLQRGGQNKLFQKV